MKADADFVRDLENSEDSVLSVARWLRRHGVDAAMVPVVVRPDVEVRSQYADCGDILVRMVVEVKQRSFNFTGAEDWPFEDVLVDEKYKVDRGIHNTLYWFQVSADGRAACVVPASGYDAWREHTFYDRAQQRQCTSYAAKKEECKWVKL